MLSGADTAELGNLPCQAEIPGTRVVVPPYPILARDEVKHVGDAVAFVVADTLDQCSGCGRGDRDRVGDAAARGRSAGGARTSAPRWYGRRNAAIWPSRPSSAMLRQRRARLLRPHVRCPSRWSISASSPTISIPRGVVAESDGGAHHAHPGQPGEPRVRDVLCEVLHLEREADARGHARCGRRLRHQALSLSRICACRRRRAAAWAGPSNGSPIAASISSPTRRAATTSRPRGWRSMPTGGFSRSTSTSSPTWAPISPAMRRSFLSRRRHVARRLRYSGVPRARARRFHQYGAGRCLSRCRAAGGGLRDRAAGRCRGARDRARARRLRRKNFISSHALYDRDREDLRFRRLRRTSFARAGDRGLAGVRAAPGKLAQERDGCAASAIATYVEACGNNGPDTARIRLDAGWRRYRFHGDAIDRAGPRHRLCADRRRSSRPRARAGAR